MYYSILFPSPPPPFFPPFKQVQPGIHFMESCYESKSARIVIFQIVVSILYSFKVKKKYASIFLLSLWSVQDICDPASQNHQKVARRGFLVKATF